MPHVAHFLAEPILQLPAPAAGSVRRTSHVDMITHDNGLLELSGVAHQGEVTATCRAIVGAARDLLSLELSPALDADGELLGLAVARGFRGVVDLICPPGTLTHLLLSELPVAALLSGYGMLYTGLMPSPLSDAYIEHLPVDICSGWDGSASFMVQIRRDHEMPTPDGPMAPPDGDGWHAMPALVAGSMRRQRLLDRTGSNVWAMFRDTCARPDGVVIVLHEYTVEAVIGAGDVIESCVATPRVLPWAECPLANDSAGRLVDQPVSSLRTLVKDEFVGTSTCTHLNDLLSSLAQADQLV
ncbi:MAG TPA: DUF2889 domain-containing protein [Acidimicrobiales bacterium]